MTWQRAISRNLLGGHYGDGSAHAIIAGDLRRLEKDSRDPRHLDAYARTTGLEPGQVLAVLDVFFESSFGELDFKAFPMDGLLPLVQA